MYYASRSSHNWDKLPGNVDALNLMKGVYMGDKFDIPILERQDFIPKDLVSYKDTLRPKNKDWDNTIHFFLDDYQFEPVWSKADVTLSRIQKIGRALTPDFSLYMDYPLALQIYNTYRNRWLGCYWQEKDVQVIPTVSWSSEASFEFCFKGIEKGSTVAISTVGTKNLQARDGFIKGFEEMTKQIEPTNIIVYGEYMPVKFEDYVEGVYKYDTHWGRKRKQP